jgi:hypothetical protein
MEFGSAVWAFWDGAELVVYLFIEGIHGVWSEVMRLYIYTSSQ